MGRTQYTYLKSEGHNIRIWNSQLYCGNDGGGDTNLRKFKGMYIRYVYIAAVAICDDHILREGYHGDYTPGLFQHEQRKSPLSCNRAITWTRVRYFKKKSGKMQKRIFFPETRNEKIRKYYDFHVWRQTCVQGRFPSFNLDQHFTARSPLFLKHCGIIGHLEN